jgi:imidazolonepropionase-like amidohydrolase
MQTLQAATRDAALFRQRPEFEGTIEPRRQADIVLLDANPIDNIRNTRKIFAVVHRGRYFDRAALDELLASVRKYASEN